MKLSKAFLFLFTLVLVGGGCAGSASIGNTTPVAAPSAAQNRYAHSQYGFSMVLPAGWTAHEDDPNFDLRFKSDRADVLSPKLNYKSHVTVSAGKFQGTALEALQANWQNTSGEGTQITTLDQSSKRVGSTDIATMHTKMVGAMNGDQLSVMAACKAYLTDESVVYVVCGYAAESFWERDRGVIEQTISSFQP